MSSSQPTKLAPAYIMDFVREVFTEDLCLVDFTQALTAMDYLKDLEASRRKEMSAALERLDLHSSSLDREKETLKNERPKVAEWVASVVDQAKRIESLYTQVYIGLRRWTLINEMRLEPFNKSNCIAMLNTLYPATYSSPPTSRLTPMLLNTQRNAFFRYILAVESNGKEVLQKLEQQGKRPAEVNAWPIVRDIVDEYLRTANSLIDDCTHTSGEDNIALTKANERRTDSGVSFASSNSSEGFVDGEIHPAHRRPSMTQASHLDVPHPRLDGSSPYHRKTSSNSDIPIMRPDTIRHKEVRKVGSTLERLARELKRMRSRSNDGRGDDLYLDRTRSTSRGPSDTSRLSGFSGDGEDAFAIDMVPLPIQPQTASTASFPDLYQDEAEDADDYVAPLHAQSRQRGLKKMRSAGNISAAGATSRDNAISSLKQSLGMERKGSAQGIANGTVTADRNPHTPHTPVTPRAGEFTVSEEQRRHLIEKARAERQNLGPHPSERRHSPLEDRVDALLNGTHSPSAVLSAMNLDLLSDAPVRRTSPGKNKLRDYYGVSNFEVPTSFAH